MTNIVSFCETTERYPTSLSVKRNMEFKWTSIFFNFVEPSDPPITSYQQPTPLLGSSPLYQLVSYVKSTVLPCLTGRSLSQEGSSLQLGRNSRNNETSPWVPWRSGLDQGGAIRQRRRYTSTEWHTTSRGPLAMQLTNAHRNYFINSSKAFRAQADPTGDEWVSSQPISTWLSNGAMPVGLDALPFPQDRTIKFSRHIPLIRTV